MFQHLAKVAASFPVFYTVCCFMLYERGLLSHCVRGSINRELDTILPDYVTQAVKTKHPKLMFFL